MTDSVGDINIRSKSEYISICTDPMAIVCAEYNTSRIWIYYANYYDQRQDTQ